jgi:hypothetical protein
MFDWPNDGPQHTRTKNSAVKSKYSNVCVFFFFVFSHPSIHLQIKVRLSGREIQLDGITSFFKKKQRGNGFGRDRTERIFQSRQPEGVICSQTKSRRIDKKKKTFEEYGQVFIIIFFFSFYLITLIENISTYFALE